MGHEVSYFFYETIFFVKAGNKEIVKLLLEAGANPDKVDRDRLSALHWSAGVRIDGSHEFIEIAIYIETYSWLVCTTVLAQVGYC